MKTLYVSDLDGTLLNSQTKISKYSLETLNKLIGEGLNFTFATARSNLGAKRVIDNLDVRLPVILCNGVKIMDLNENKLLFTNYFSKDDVLKMREISTKFDILPVVYQTKNNTDKFYYIDYKISVGMRYYLDNRTNDPRLNKVLDLDDLFTSDVYYFNFIDTYDNLKPLYDEVKKYFTCIFQQEIYRDEYWLEVVPNNVNKGVALDKLREILNVDEIVYFGDSLNDLYAFNKANKKIAVQNAKEEVKKHADLIISGNDFDGVVKYILNDWRNVNG